jgi:hypothetical protein
MMVPERHPGWVTGINDFEARLTTGALFTSQQVGDQLDPLRVRPGIRDAPGNPGRITLGSNKATVNAFQAVIQDPARPALGAYVVTLDAPKDLALTGSDPSLGRIDLVIGEVDSTVDPGFTVHVVEGQPSPSPQAPTVTNPLHIKLGQIQIPPAGATPTYVDLRQFTVTLGGVLPVRSVAERPTVAPSSQLVYRLDTGVLEVQKTTGWTPYRPPRGSVDTWHAVTFQNGWSNYGGGYAEAAYTMTEDGWVRLRGLVKGGVVDKAVFTLPAGYRPVATHIFTAYSGGHLARLDVRADGYVGGEFDSAPSNSFLSLEGIFFATYP